MNMMRSEALLHSAGRPMEKCSKPGFERLALKTFPQIEREGVIKPQVFRHHLKKVKIANSKI